MINAVAVFMPPPRPVPERSDVGVQSTQSIDAVSEAFNLTAGESRLLLSAPRGEGLLVAGRSRIPFRAVGSAAEHRIAETGFELEESDR
ncbi:hypothetical protein ABZ793_33595 [Micromonospora sp. NPDC047465]|uniref:hypothetical protein n=1 Tax=Micromonospora sp. NPDC047465 TaxID=3154813 RepID=UPI0033D5375B